MRSNSQTKKSTSSKRVFVGLSGGVDSAVSAALLQEQGYDVTGVFIRIALPGYPCPAAQDRREAMRVAAHLRIPFTEIDLSQEYKTQVFADTLAQYGAGRTPNPDTLCNREIKFGAFYAFAKTHGADYIATGHYAQTNGQELYAGADPLKDQSYFLWMVPQEVLAHTLFPVGALTKKHVRALAQKFALPNAARKDSQGLCFLGNLSMEELLVRELAPTQGQVLNANGEVIGTHRGAALYTLGQRHGFEVAQLRGTERAPLYVIAKDTAANTLTVSPQQFPLGATATKVTLQETNWLSAVSSGRYAARYRYHQPLIPCELTREQGTVLLHEPHYVPLGQSLVLYDGARCLGGGIVDNSTLQA